MSQFITIPAEIYHIVVDKAARWDKWAASGAWETDNTGQVIIYTGLDSDGNEIESDEEE